MTGYFAVFQCAPQVCILNDSAVAAASNDAAGKFRLVVTCLTVFCLLASLGSSILAESLGFPFY